MTRTRALTRLLAALPLLLVALVGWPAPPAHAASSYSADLATAIDDLDVRTESRTGYQRTLFEHWIDADGDGCDTRDEVLISEADDPVSVGSGCSLSGGRWYSYYDGVSQTDAGDLDIDHLVPLAEAWDSGASDWSAARRRDYANDLGDARALIAVTAAENRSKGDQDPAEWLPAKQQCRYVEEWVAIKHRWSLAIDSTEKATLTELATDCEGEVEVQVV